MEQIEDLNIGGLRASARREIQDAVVDMGVDLTLDMTTQMRFTVVDPDFKMAKANYFQVRRPVGFKGFDYEIAGVEWLRTAGRADECRITMRSLPIQRMRREKGEQNWYDISAAEFAKQMAETHGLKMFIQDSPQRPGIIRKQGEDIDESTWDVLQRLSAELEYIVFESYGVLYFTSEEFLIERQPSILVDMFALETDPWFPYSFALVQNDDDWKGSAFTLQVGREQGQKIRPGMNVEFTNCGVYSDGRKHLITSVTWTEADVTPVAVQGRTLKETEDTVADTSVGRGVAPWGSRVLQEGMGTPDNPQADVRQLQSYLVQNGYICEESGIFDSVTVAAVKSWQIDNELGIETITLVSDLNPGERARYGTQETITTYIVDGIVDVDDWAVILAGAPSTKVNIDSSLVDPPRTFSTAGALKIDLGFQDFIHDPDLRYEYP